MRPEAPYVAAGLLAVALGVRRDGRFPDKGLEALLATLLLAAGASLTAGSKIAPVVRAIGMLLVLGTALSFTPKGKKAVSSVAQKYATATPVAPPAQLEA